MTSERKNENLLQQAEMKMIRWMCKVQTVLCHVKAGVRNRELWCSEID